MCKTTKVPAVQGLQFSLQRILRYWPPGSHISQALQESWPWWHQKETPSETQKQIQEFLPHPHPTPAIDTAHNDTASKLLQRRLWYKIGLQGSDFVCHTGLKWWSLNDWYTHWPLADEPSKSSRTFENGFWQTKNKPRCYPQQRLGNNASKENLHARLFPNT